MSIKSVRVVSLHHVQTWKPPTDVYETDDSVVVQTEAAGMRDGHFHVSLQGQTLTISGIRSDRSGERRAYHQMEINTGEFRDEINLPAPVDPESMSARYDDGILEIRLRKVNK